MEFLTTNFLTIFTTLFGGGSLAVLIFERKKNKAIAKGAEADADSKDIQNGKELVSMYKDAMDDMTDRAEKKFQEIIEMYDRKIKVLQDEIRLHKRYVNALKQENTELRKKIKDAESNSTK
jgi:predicted RNase H-like nuclease (RuvC/YqgF family)